MNAKEVEAAFRAELQALLDKWGAELEATNHWGPVMLNAIKDVRMTVTIPSIYKDYEEVREFVEIDLGDYQRGNK